MSESIKRYVKWYKSRINNEVAQRYLDRLNLNNQDAIEKFDIAYCDGSYLKHIKRQSSSPLSYKNFKQSFAADGLLDGSHQEKFRSGLIFPLYGDDNSLKQVWVSKVSERLKSGRYELLLNDCIDILWNQEALKVREVILTNGILDGLSCWVNGYHNVSSVLHIDTFNDWLVGRLLESNVKQVVLALSYNDLKSDQVIKFIGKLVSSGFVVLKVQLPRTMTLQRYAMKKDLGDLFDSVVAVQGIVSLSNSATDKSICKTAHESTCNATSPTPSFSSSPASTSSITKSLKSYEADSKQLNLSKNQKDETPIQTKPSPEIVKESKAKVEITKENVLLTIKDREYRVRGLFRNISVDTLKVNLRVKRLEGLFVDNLELYSHRQRLKFIHQASLEMGVSEELIKKDLTTIMLELEKVQDGNIKNTLEIPQMSPEDREAALQYLRDPALISRIMKDIDESGLVGEKHNKIAGYLALISRKLQKPLAIIIQSTSAAGKSSLLETLLSFVPDEDKLKYSSITPQSLYYMAEKGIKHKILAVAEGEGASKASYSLKLLQSEGELMINSTSGDSKGLASKEYRVEGPVMVAMTTTALDVDDELLNRCIVLTVDETREQTELIHHAQRENHTLKGLLARQNFQSTLNLHRNSQRLLEPILVLNPYAPQLTFQSEQTRFRRDHVKYLTLVQAIAFLYQHQRQIHTKKIGDKTARYIEVTIEDIRLANTLAHHVLGTTLDQLPAHTRKLLHVIDRFVTEGCRRRGILRRGFRFTRKELREHTQMGDTQLKIHLKRLVDQEFLVLSKVNRKHVYECLYDGQGKDGKPFVMGLIDVEKLSEPA